MGRVSTAARLARCARSRPRPATGPRPRSTRWMPPCRHTVLSRFGIEFNEWVAEWCETRRRRARADRPASEGSRLMFDALARLADRRARRVGCRRSSSSSPPERSAAPSPTDSTPTAPTTPRRERPGRRAPRGGGLPRDRADRPVRRPGRSSPPSARRVETTCATCGTRRRRDRHRLLRHRLRDSSPATGDATYLAVALEPTDDKAWQDGAESIEGQLSRAPGRLGRRARARPARSTTRSSRTCGGPSCSPSRCSSCSRCSSSAASSPRCCRC